MQPVHVAAYVEALQAERSAPTVKQHLACIRMLFRLARYRLGGPVQSGARGARAALFGKQGFNAGAVVRGSYRAAARR